MRVELNQIADSVIELKFRGHLDEASDLPDLNFKDIKCMTIDLEPLEHINSVGILKWKRWQDQIRGLNGTCEIHLYGCHKQFINIINIFEGLLTENTRVDSFFIPFYCEKCDHLKELLINTAKDVRSFSKNAVEIALDQEICPKCNKAMETEVSVFGYVAFLERYGSKPSVLSPDLAKKTLRF
jgi:hypothetical protein